MKVLAPMHLCLNVSLNAILINNTKEIAKIDAGVNRRLFRTILRSKERGISNKALLRLKALFQITTIKHKLEMDARSLTTILKRVANDDSQPTNRNIAKVRDHARRSSG